MSLPKTIRNKKIIKLRMQNPKKWSWRVLADQFNMDHTTVQKMFKRELAKVTTYTRR